MNTHFIALLGLIFINQFLSAQTKEFKSDGCTCFKDGTFKNKTLWYDCCYVHDSLYWIGGTPKDRLHADSLLKVCVEAKGYPFIAKQMYIGVRAFGGALLPTPWRWGFGWKYGHNFKK